MRTIFLDLYNFTPDTLTGIEELTFDDHLWIVAEEISSSDKAILDNAHTRKTYFPLRPNADEKLAMLAITKLFEHELEGLERDREVKRIFYLVANNQDYLNIPVFKWHQDILHLIPNFAAMKDTPKS